MIEAALEESRAHQAFLLRLGDALSAIDDPAEIGPVSARLVGEQLRTSRSVYSEIDDGGLPPMVGSMHFPESGDIVAIDDVAVDVRLDEDLRGALLAAGAASIMGMTLVKKGRGVATFGCHHARPRHWTGAEIALMREAVDRIWSASRRARSETALARSEAKYRTLFETIDEGFCIIEVLFDGDGRPADYRFLELNPAFAAHTGLTDAVGRTMRALVPDHEAFWFETYGEIARTGEPKSFEHRAVAMNRWFDVHAFRFGPAEAHQVAIVFRDISDRKQAEAAQYENEERLRLLVAELQHRVRNILTVIRSVFSRTVDTHDTIEDITEHFQGRLDALARTQISVAQASNGKIDLENLIREELLSVGAGDGPHVTIDGPDVSLTPEQAEPLGLAVHELTTNALKYGALRTAGAHLDIRWSANIGDSAPGRLDLTWTEQGVPAVPVSAIHQGFGTELIEEALPYRLGADTKIEFLGGGIRCSISLPLAGESRGAFRGWKVG